MATLAIALAAGLAFIVAYHTYGRWLGSKIFNVSAGYVCPSHRLRDDRDYVPTARSIVFGHHFTSIAGTGPIVGPAIAVMWGWLPALLWVVFGSIFIGAVHDFGSLVVSLRNNGQTVGDIAGRVLSRRARLLFLFILFLALTIVIAIFGLVIAAVFRQYPQAIFPCVIQIPIAIAIGVYLHKQGKSLVIPSIIALFVMYLTVIFGDVDFFTMGETPIGLHALNQWMASWPTIVWVAVLLVYSYIASVLPVWTLLQPRDYINSLQLLTALALIVVGLIVAAAIGGAPPVEGADRQPLEIVAPVVQWQPEGAPLIFPFLFITIACGAISGFHCLVSSGTSSKQLKTESDARFVGYGSMLTEGFLATLVILACCAGLGLGSSTNLTFNASIFPGGPIAETTKNLATDRGDFVSISYQSQERVNVSRFQSAQDNPVFGDELIADRTLHEATFIPEADLWLTPLPDYEQVRVSEWSTSFRVAPTAKKQLNQSAAIISASAWRNRYESWSSASGLGAKVGAFVDGAGNFLKAMGIPGSVAVALMGVLVASFAGTTLDTACRLQRYVVQELARAIFGKPVEAGAVPCANCGYDLRGSDAAAAASCPECGHQAVDESGRAATVRERGLTTASSATLFENKYVATLVAVLVGFVVAALPMPGKEWSLATAGTGGLILWPMFGATNQLLGGLAFLVIAFYLRRRGKPIWFLVLPLVFMLVMPAWAMVIELPKWIDGAMAGSVSGWALVIIAVATLLLEVWMIIEAVILWPRVKGLLEDLLPGNPPDPAVGNAQG